MAEGQRCDRCVGWNFLQGHSCPLLLSCGIGGRRRVVFRKSRAEERLLDMQTQRFGGWSTRDEENTGGR